MTESGKTAAPPASASKPRRASPLLVFILLFVVYNANFRCVRFGDTVSARVLPFSLLLEHTFYLDHWFDTYTRSEAADNGTYYLRESHGHRMSAYPVIMPLVMTPLYIVPAWLVARQHPPLARDDVVMIAVLDTMESLCASLIAALSGMFLYLAFQKLCSPGTSLLLALIYGLASSTWSISSQGLWRHGFTELSFALLLWGLLQDKGSNRRALWCGIALALAGANSLSNVVVVLALVPYFARQSRREFVRFFIPLALLGSATLGYNYHFFGRLMGGYPSFIVHSGGETHLYKGTPAWIGLLGLLVSPGRGLFFFMPWTVLAIWGMARAWKQNIYGWERYVIVGMVAVLIEHSSMGRWWGGWSFGPRYLTVLLPFLVFFMIPVWPRIQARTLLRGALIVCVSVSLWIQFVGAFYYPNGQWDELPVNVDQNPHRLWEWIDNPIRRSWQAGLARPTLYYELYLLPILLESSPAGHSRVNGAHSRSPQAELKGKTIVKFKPA